MHPSLLLSTAVAICMGALSLFGQSSAASLSGTIQDEQERVITTAKVRLHDSAKGFSREVMTDASGTFIFSQIAPSTYELAIEHPGFAKACFTNIAINATDQQSLRLVEVAARDETMIVTGETPLVRESPAVATSVDRAFIENQPLNGRSFQTLINLSPGVVLVPSTLPDAGQFSVNGQRSGTNYFTVDGVGANFGLPFATTPYEGAGGGTPSFSSQGSTSALASVDAVQEFTIQTSTYAPEYG
ncbi:MAG: carboxypeptidase regulatory-like domain-containing protein [Bryobacteraceae bacterium]